MKKKFLFLMALLAVSLLALAEMTVYVYKKDGTKVPYVTSTIDSIGFVDVNDIADGHQWVDLGLPSGTKWATMNVGADSPEEYGDYFAWGETTPKLTYNYSTYKLMTSGMSSWDGVNKYTVADGYTSAVWYNSYGNFIGDNKTTLDLSDDAAYVNWGSSWRMPTSAELDELCNTSYTTWTWTTQNSIKGYIVTSKTNGHSIFLPAAGFLRDSELVNPGTHGYYNSSSLNEGGTTITYVFYFYKSNAHISSNNPRIYGQSVRPVLRE